MIEYRTINTRTIQGIQQAERLQRLGWTIGSEGFETIQFWRQIPRAAMGPRANTGKGDAMTRKDREERLLDAVRHGMTNSQARDFVRLAIRHNRLAEAECNGDYPCDNGARPVLACSRCEAGYVPTHIRRGLCDSCRTEDAIAALCKEVGVSVVFQGDPRGWTVKLGGEK